MSDSTNHVELAAEIVSAYVSNNSVPSSELPTLLSDVHAAIVRVASGAQPVVVEAAKPAVPPKKSITSDYIICLGGRPKVQVAEAAFADPVQSFPRRISGEVGPSLGLSDGRSGLRQGALGSREADGTRPAAPAPQVRPPPRLRTGSISRRSSFRRRADTVPLLSPEPPIDADFANVERAAMRRTRPAVVTWFRTCGRPRRRGPERCSHVR